MRPCFSLEFPLCLSEAQLPSELSTTAFFLVRDSHIFKQHFQSAMAAEPRSSPFLTRLQNAVKVSVSQMENLLNDEDQTLDSLNSTTMTSMIGGYAVGPRTLLLACRPSIPPSVAVVFVYCCFCCYVSQPGCEVTAARCF